MITENAGKCVVSELKYACGNVNVEPIEQIKIDMMDLLNIWKAVL